MREDARTEAEEVRVLAVECHTLSLRLRGLLLRPQPEDTRQRVFAVAAHVRAQTHRLHAVLRELGAEAAALPRMDGESLAERETVATCTRRLHALTARLEACAVRLQKMRDDGGLGQQAAARCLQAAQDVSTQAVELAVLETEPLGSELVAASEQRRELHLDSPGAQERPTP